MYTMMLLALIAVGGAAFNVYLWNDSRTVRAELLAERDARLTQRQQDVRQMNIGKVAQCRQSIGAIKVANQVIDDLRADHVARAEQARALAKADPTEALASLHRSIARQQEAKARTLVDFPTRTRADCDRLARKLGVAGS